MIRAADTWCAGREEPPTIVERLPTPREAITGPYRDKVPAALAGEAEVTRWKKRGAEMDRYEIVAFAMATLEGD